MRQNISFFHSREPLILSGESRNIKMISIQSFPNADIESTLVVCTDPNKLHYKGVQLTYTFINLRLVNFIIVCILR